MKLNELNYQEFDLLMHEYKQPIDYFLNLPDKVVQGLLGAMGKRKKEEQKMWAQIIGIATGCAFAGRLDKLDSLFNDAKQETTDEDFLNQSRTLWVKMGRKLEDFEKQLKTGNVRF